MMKEVAHYQLDIIICVLDGFGPLFDCTCSYNVASQAFDLWESIEKESGQKVFMYVCVYLLGSGDARKCSAVNSH